MSEGKIYTHCPDIFPGVRGTFQHLSAVAGTVHFNNPTEIFKIVKEKPDLVILGGYLDYYTQVLFTCKKEGVKTAILFTSTLGQAELSSDFIELAQLNALKKMLERNEITYLLFGSSSLSGVFASPKIKRYWNPFSVDYVQKHLKQTENLPTQKVNGIVMFMPFAPRKNIVNQLMAVKILQRDDPSLLLLTNNIAPQYRIFCNDFGIVFQDMGWLHPINYYRALQRAKASLQITLCEAFDYVAAESICSGTPVIVAPSVEWLYKDNTIGSVRHPDSIPEIYKALKETLTKPDQILEEQTKRLQEMCELHNSKAKELLKELTT